MKMKLTVRFVNTHDCCMSVMHLNCMPPVHYRTSVIKLTDDQVEKMKCRIVGNQQDGSPIFEEREVIALEDEDA